MSEVPPLPGRVLSMDQIRTGLSDLAENGEGAQRTQAYRMLMSMSNAEAVLPDPMSDGEIVERATRILRGIGVRRARIAFLQAFPRRPSTKAFSKQALSIEELRIDTSDLPRTLKAFYKRYPEAKRPGFPKGYPVGRGMLDQQAFIKEASVKIEVDRARARLIDTEMELSEGPDDREEITPQGQTPAD